MTIIKCMNKFSEYYDDIASIIKFLEKTHPIEVLFAAIIGSIAMDLDNTASDVDMFLIFKKKEAFSVDLETTYQKSSHSRMFDIFWVDCELLNYPTPLAEKLNVSYFSLTPTRLNHHKTFDYTCLPGENNCKISSFIADVLFCNKIYDAKAFLGNHINQLTPLLSIYDFCKNRYVSACGRLEKYLIEKGAVRLRSYLYTLHEIFSVEHALQSKDLPPVHFRELLHTCNDNNIYRILEEYYYLNKQDNGKEKVLIDPNEELNYYIAQHLDRIKPQMINQYHAKQKEFFDVKVVY